MEGSRSFLRYWMPVGLWALVIFSASTDMMSSSHTSRFIGPILRWLIPDISDEAVVRVQWLVRKAAHMGEYAVLSMLLWRAQRKPHRGDTRGWEWPPALVAVLASGLYAVTDEWHQSTVPSRGASGWDVGLDTMGAAFGMCLVWGVGRWMKQW